MTNRVRYTMDVVNGVAARRHDDNIPPLRRPLTEDDRNNNAAIINGLRVLREGAFRTRIYQTTFGPRPLRLPSTLPLPDLQLDTAEAPWLLSIEHLQDFCNKSTAIYCKGGLEHDFTPMSKFILKHWLHLDSNAQGDIHRLDIEFARFFAKLVGLRDPQISTQQIIDIHEALINASLAAHQTGYLKEGNWGYTMDHNFIGGQQIEFFKVKPLLRALIIIIDKRIDKPFEETPDFTKQEVRLVRTGLPIHLCQPVTFEDLKVIKKVNENEVITTLSEAIQFIVALDQKEESMLDKKSETALDYWLGLPKGIINLCYCETANICMGIWTGEEKDLPVGPSTRWWKEGLLCQEKKPGLTEEIIKRRKEAWEAGNKRAEARQKPLQARQ